MAIRSIHGSSFARKMHLMTGPVPSQKSLSAKNEHMDQCVPSMMDGGMHQDQAVATCLHIWDGEHPREDENKAQWMERCADKLTAGGKISEDIAYERCENIWADDMEEVEERAMPMKPHKGESQSDFMGRCM